MRKLVGVTLHCVVFGILAVCAGSPLGASEIVGINVYNEGALSHPQQDAEIEQLAASGVKTIRTGLNTNSIYFITQASKHGIGSIVLVYPNYGSQAKALGKWSRVPLSGDDPQGLAKWLQAIMDQFDAGGIRLTGIEVGNEVNTSGYNGDIAEPGSGRVLSISDLNNANDKEAKPVAAGLINYIHAVAAVQTVRDHSKVNSKTPIISAGLADWGPPGPKAWNKSLGVSLPDTMEFLRQNGMDKFVDGYGVHYYPSGDAHQTVAVRTAQLQQKILAQCTSSKPCWLTEWGFGNNTRTCPVDDSTRAQVIEAERNAFKASANQGRLAAIVYYTWDSNPNTFDPMSVYRCDAVTAAGKTAISPM